MKVTVILTVECNSASIGEVSTAIMYGRRQIEEYLVLSDATVDINKVFRLQPGETVLSKKSGEPVTKSSHPTRPETPKAFVPFRPTLPQVSK